MPGRLHLKMRTCYRCHLLKSTFSVLLKPHLTTGDKTIWSGTWPSPSANTRFVVALLSWAESVRSTADRKGGAAVTSASEEEEYDREG